MEIKTLYTILGALQIFFVTSFILSARAYFRTEAPLFIRYFFIYPTVALVMIIFFWFDFLKITPKGFFSDLNFFSLIFHFIFLTWFILQVIKSSGSYQVERIIRAIFILCILASVVNDYVNGFRYSYVLVNGMLFFYCFFYFGRLFKNNPYLHLTSQPAFWIITGIFLGMGITLPFYIFHEFLLVRITKNTHNLLGLIGGVGYATMHIFFIKGFICNHISVGESRGRSSIVKINELDV